MSIGQRRVDRVPAKECRVSLGEKFKAEVGRSAGRCYSVTFDCIATSYNERTVLSRVTDHFGGLLQTGPVVVDCPDAYTVALEDRLLPNNGAILWIIVLLKAYVHL